MSDRQKIKKITLSTKVPRSWGNKLEELAEQTGRSPTDLLREALAQYLGVEDQKSADIDRLGAIEAELAALNQKVAELEPYKTQMVAILTRLVVVERAVANNQHPGNITQTFSVEMQAIADDDIDDEPDEILIDFLPNRS
jgi:predicted transcriptional regulator